MESHGANTLASNEPIRFDVMAAMCHGNRGIGYKGKLPWPNLPQDYAYYIGHSTSFRNQSNIGCKKIIHIRGRMTWLSAGEAERNAPHVYNIIVSKTLTPGDCNSPHVLKIVPTFDDAIACVNHLDSQGEVDSVWIMGGSRIYQDALLHPQFRQLYLTHVYTDFPSDAFFPTFDESFKELQNFPDKGKIIEENGVKYEFKIYSK